ncbi:maleylpyruvate isomerase family mycothiol-dependent enzyme [Acidimicrobiia bacterium EGI L10123]|uniref:maleylpyruvate isomerase family mycothiol-dependent enzyme n=1 Tax=Salinilacustrithrix flava TaxID=2957203 RepID=UPI003D7C1AE2|nr:maleylpyruvate isomerase family mycothiol-dependent enzyme [Acidimicrobiia bacterium EGI L10123]
MEPSTHLAHLRVDIDRILATPAEHLGALVKACPGWTVTDLLGHHAGVFRFATAQLRAEPGSDFVPFDPPEEGVPPLEMLAVAGEELLAALAETDPTEHRPNWADAPTAAFWFRRLAHETAIHRVDVQLTHTTPDPIDTALAVDGVDELGEVFLRHAGRRGITGTGETVHLHATDDAVASGEIGGGEWMFTFHEDGVEVTHDHGKGDMAVRGPAGQLVLFAWNRRPVEVECFGDPDPLAFWAETVRI